MNTIERKTTELKLYSPLYGELSEKEYDVPRPLEGGVLCAFQNTIRQGIEDEQMPEEEERGLMTCFDGSDAVNEKVVSVFPTVEEVGSQLYGVAVCQLCGALSPDELSELKAYCRSQYAMGWGEGFAQRPRRTDFGDLYVSFWQEWGTPILTREEMETRRVRSRAHSQPRRGGESR